MVEASARPYPGDMDLKKLQHMTSGSEVNPLVIESQQIPMPSSPSVMFSLLYLEKYFQSLTSNINLYRI